MIQKKTTPAVPVVMLSWPDNFYTEQNPDIRLSLLETNYGSDPVLNAFRKKLFEMRYTTEKQGREEVYIDRFAQAWLMMNVSARQGVGLFNRKSLIKEWHGYMKNLCIEDFVCENAQEHELLTAEWKAFFNQQIACCMADKGYGSMLYGIISLKKESISGKIADELDLLTETFPENLGLKDAFAEFHRIAEQVYTDSSLT